MLRFICSFVKHMNGSHYESLLSRLAHVMLPCGCTEAAEQTASQIRSSIVVAETAPSPKVVVNYA
jgi:hypothetical protein